MKKVGTQRRPSLWNELAKRGYFPEYSYRDDTPLRHHICPKSSSEYLPKLIESTKDHRNLGVIHEVPINKRMTAMNCWRTFISSMTKYETIPKTTVIYEFDRAEMRMKIRRWKSDVLTDLEYNHDPRTIVRIENIGWTRGLTVRSTRMTDYEMNTMQGRWWSYRFDAMHDRDDRLMNIKRTMNRKDV